MDGKAVDLTGIESRPRRTLGWGMAMEGTFHRNPGVLLGSIRTLAAIGVISTLTACGSGGGGASDVFLPAKILAVTSPVASQGAIGGGEALLAFRVALADIATFPIELSFNVSSSAVIGTSCSAGVDYYIPVVAGMSVSVNTGTNTATGRLTMATSTSTRNLNVRVCPRNSNTDLKVLFDWTGGDSSGRGTGTILGAANTDLNASDRLNDTGITTCSDGTTNGLTCSQSAYPGQDAEVGRDATPTVTGTGTNKTTAFAFSTLTGVIQDNTTGLMWEAKTTDGALHDINSTFTWFSSNAGTNGGSSGTASGGTCAGVVAGCDIEKFVAAVNTEKLGGFSDWRVPSVQELSSLVDSGKSTAPTVEATIANQSAAAYWTASPKAGDATGAWSVDFNSGSIASDAKSNAKRVRLVRGR